MSARAHDLRTRPAARKPDLRVVHRRSRPRAKSGEARRSLSVLIVGGIVAVVIIAAILLEQVVLVQSAFNLSDLRKQLEAAEAKHEVLVLEASQLDSSARIERYARENLGMVNPDPGGIEYIVANIKQPKGLADRVGGKHRRTLPTDSVAAGAPYAYGGP